MIPAEIDWASFFSVFSIFTGFSKSDFLKLSSFLEFFEYSPSELIIEEGDTQLGLFLVLEGKVCVHRAGRPLELRARGDYFGELGLITGMPRSASIHSETVLRLAHLSDANFERMQMAYPQESLVFLQEVIRDLGTHLVAMTDRLGLLWNQRSLPRQRQIKITLNEELLMMSPGVILTELMPSHLDGEQVVAALLNHKIVSLNTRLFSDADLVPLTVKHWEGERVYRRSARLLCLEALAQILPEEKSWGLSVAVGGAQWLETQREMGSVELDKLALALQMKLKQLMEQTLSFRQEVWTIEEARIYFNQRGLTDLSALLETHKSGHVSLGTCGEFFTLSHGPLVPSTTYLEPIKITATRHGLLIRTHSTPQLNEVLEPYAEMLHINKFWLSSMGIQSVGSFNKVCINGEVSQVIRVAEGFHEKQIGQLADQIAAASDRIKIVCIAGPSSSGKSTFIQRLNVQLQVNGLNPVGISLDNYYVNRIDTPRDASGEFDYEALHALNLPLLGEQLEGLLAGRTLPTASYDFIQGKSQFNGGPTIKLEQGAILMLEGIHGLNPSLLPSSIPESAIFRIFIQPMNSLAFDGLSKVNPSDLRLIRRIVRDRRQRGTTPTDNIRRWSSVRRGERLHIYPYVQEADIIFDTSLVYELAVLKVYAERYLLEVPSSEPEYATAYRLRELLNLFIPIYPEHVPPTSLLREFIGKSGFEY